LCGWKNGRQNGTKLSSNEPDRRDNLRIGFLSPRVPRYGYLCEQTPVIASVKGQLPQAILQTFRVNLTDEMVSVMKNQPGGEHVLDEDRDK